MEIDRHKIKVNTFTAELDEPIDRSLRTLVTIEAEIYSVDYPDNQDGSFDQVYRAKLCGTTIVKQGDKKPILGKSKRSASQRLRMALYSLNPDEDFYQSQMDKLIANAEDVVEYLKNR